MKECHNCRRNFGGTCTSHSKTGIIYSKFYDAVIEEIGTDLESLTGFFDIYGVPCLTYRVVVITLKLFHLLSSV